MIFLQLFPYEAKFLGQAGAFDIDIRIGHLTAEYQSQPGDFVVIRRFLLFPIEALARFEIWFDFGSPIAERSLCFVGWPVSQYEISYCCRRGLSGI